MQGKTMALRIVSVVLVVICMGVIFMFSAEDAAKSDSTSKGTIIALAGVIKKDFNKMSQQQRDEFVADLNGAVRTSAHFSVYCLLGLLVANALYAFSFRRWRLAAFSVGISLLYAISDEIHQYFVPGRACELIDVTVDTMGAVLGTAIFICAAAVAVRISDKKKGKEKNDTEINAG